MTVVGDNVFNGCKRLFSVSLSSSLESIGKQAFYGCGALQNITLPESLRTIGESAFEESGLRELIVPESVTQIGDAAFYRCGQLRTATIKGNSNFPRGSQIRRGVFCYCGNLEEVKLNDDIQELPDLMFCYCYKLKKINLPPKLKTIGFGVFQGYSGKELRLPDTVTIIGTKAFCYAKMEKVALSKGMASTGYETFYHADQMTAIYIPKSVKSIERSAFEECDKLKDIYYSGSEADWANMKIESEGNEALSNVTIHYNASVSDLGLTEEFSLLSLLGL